MNHGMIRFIATLFLACLSLMAQGVEVVTYYHNDALGSPIIATDQQGRVVWRKSYAPYGQPIGPAAPNEPGYTGKFEEPDLGIQNFGARWYDPRIGRFLAIDPAGFDPQNPQSFNRYAYAHNNPYKYVDPDGRVPVDTIWDFGNVVYDVVNGNWGDAAIDAGAMLIPFVPAGISKLRHVDDAAEAGGDAAQAAKGQIFERVMNKGELDATHETGLLRGGRAGENFFTNNASIDAKRAQQRLGLDGPLRDYRVRFKITNDVEITGPRPAKPGQSGTPGRGGEYSTTEPTEIEVIGTDPLRK